MSKQRISAVPSLLRSLILISLLTVPLPLCAQESEIPPLEANQPELGPDGQPARIVEGRPALQTAKRALHPFTWFEAGLRPIFRAVEKTGVQSELVGNNPASENTAKKSGVKISLDSMGSRSGFGPEVTLFHHDLLGRGIEFEVPLLITFRRYESYGFRTSFPLIPAEGDDDRVALELSGSYRSRPMDNFFGLGNESPRSDMTRFRTVSRNAAIALDTKINNTWGWRGQLGYTNVGVTEPRGFRSAQHFFTEEQAPGLFTGAKIISAAVSLERNTRNAKELSSSGSLNRVEVSLNEARGGGDFSYWKYRYELLKYFSLSDDGRKVIAFRGEVETNEEKGGSRIPFFDMPIVGSRSTVRGFESLRFVDKSAISFGVEYRYRIWRAFDWALFVDQGQVAPEIGDFDLNRFHTGYGMRFIVRPKEDRAISLDLGRGREGWRFYVGFNPTF